MSTRRLRPLRLRTILVEAEARAAQVNIIEDCRISALGRADVSAAGRALETAPRFGDDLLWQPQDDFREIDRKADGGEENDINGQRRPQRLRESHADEFRRHQQDQAIGWRDEAER